MTASFRLPMPITSTGPKSSHGSKEARKRRGVRRLRSTVRRGRRRAGIHGEEGLRRREDGGEIAMGIRTAASIDREKEEREKDEVVRAIVCEWA